MDIQKFRMLLRNVQPTQREGEGLLYALSYHMLIFIYFLPRLSSTFLYIFALLILFGLDFSTFFYNAIFEYYDCLSKCREV